MLSQLDTFHRYRLPIYKTILCLSCALILLLNGFGLFHNLQALKGAHLLRDQDAHVSRYMQNLNWLLLDAESGVRGYFLTDSVDNLLPLSKAHVELEKHLSVLEKLLSDNPIQMSNMAQLRRLVQRRLDLIDDAIARYRQGGLVEVIKLVYKARAVHDEVRLLVVNMELEQNKIIAARNAAFYHEYQKTLILGLSTNAVAIILLLLLYQLSIRSLKDVKQVTLALQSANDMLETMVMKRTEQLSVLSHHLINVSEEEKASLARELHDEMGANLAAINMDLAAVQRQLQHIEPELAELLQRAKLTLRDTVQLKRRIVENLRPSLLDNLGLRAALENYCEEFSRMTQVPCELELELDLDRSQPTLIIALFRIVQEALTNIMKYAQASHVRVSLKRRGAGLVLSIIDNGIGIAHDALVKPRSHGLLGMHERALLLGGSLTIGRDQEGRGTCVEALIPDPHPLPSALI